MHVLTEGNQRIGIREKMPEFSLTVLSRGSPYIKLEAVGLFIVNLKRVLCDLPPGPVPFAPSGS